jgi:hypothetical protein
MSVLEPTAMQQWPHCHVQVLISWSRQVEQEQAMINIVAGLLACTLLVATAAHAADAQRRVIV